MQTLRRSVCFMLCMSLVLSVFAQSTDERIFELPPVVNTINSKLYDELFVVFIRTTLQNQQASEPWQRYDIHYTLNNNQLALNFINNDAMAIQISVTPQKRTQDSLVILVSWQLWFKTQGNKVHYMNAANFYVIKPGEKIIFYPYGAKKEHQPIIIEILVDTYMHAQEQGGIKVRSLIVK